MCHCIAICFYDSQHSAALWDRCAGAEFECWSVVTVSQCSDSLPGSQTRWAAVPPTIPYYTLPYITIPNHTLHNVLKGGVRIFFDFAKTNELILSCWLSYWMSNQEYINFHHFWPFYGHFWAKFAPKCLLLAIGSPSSPKWVGHWVNMVGHCWTHPGG